MMPHTRKSISSMFMTLLTCTWLMQASDAVAASFPCEKAKTTVEKKICADPGLSVLDEHLGRYYSAARISLAHDNTCLVEDQRRWLRNVRNACKDAACLEREYLKRLAVLDALQPGATRIAGLALPDEMSLAWIIPPASDEVAAPRDLRTQPLVVRGTLVDEVVDGDGHVLLATDGTRHLLMSLMFLESPTAEHLSSLAALPGTLYEAHGRVVVSDEGTHDFAANSCTYLYRASP